MTNKKIPVRMCVGCAQHLPKNELVRIVCSPEGTLSVDTTGRKPGRGAYLCRNAACLQQARKARRLERAFERDIPPEVYARLEEELGGNG